MIKTASSTTSVELADIRGWASWGKTHAPCSAMFLTGLDMCCTNRHGKHPWEIPFHFGGIRRPEDWYGSLWQHTLKRPQFHAGRDRLIVPTHGEGFRGFLYGATHLKEASVPQDRPLVILDLWPEVPRPDGSVGLFSWCVDFFFRQEGAWLVDALIPVDRLKEGLSKVLGEDVSPPLKNTAKGRLDPLDPVTDSRSEQTMSYQDWYDDEMLSWIAEADAQMVQTFGFRPFEPSPQAVYNLASSPKDQLQRGRGKT